MAKIILVASGKGGAGKSTVSALLGETFAFSGRPTLLIELDSGLRSLDVALGVTRDLVFDLGDVMRGSCEAKDAATACPFCPMLSVICAAAKPVAVPATAISEIAETVGAAFDYIILDCPAGIGYALEFASECADMALVVATPDPSSIRAARSASLALEAHGLEDRRLVIERCPQKPKKLAPLDNLDQVIDGAELRLIAVIWEDPETRAAVDSGRALSADSPNRKTFIDLARRILGERVPLGFQ